MIRLRDRAETLRRGVAGLRSVTDEGEALLEALETLVAAAGRGRITDRSVRAAYETAESIQRGFAGDTNHRTAGAFS